MKLGKHVCFSTDWIDQFLSLEWGRFSYRNLVEYGLECELHIEKSGVVRDDIAVSCRRRPKQALMH